MWNVFTAIRRVLRCGFLEFQRSGRLQSYRLLWLRLQHLKGWGLLLRVVNKIEFVDRWLRKFKIWRLLFFLSRLMRIDRIWLESWNSKTINGIRLDNVRFTGPVHVPHGFNLCTLLMEWHIAHCFLADYKTWGHGSVTGAYHLALHICDVAQFYFFTGHNVRDTITVLEHGQAGTDCRL